MHILKINGITIEFPYEPYPAQVATMTTVLRSFIGNSASLVESPTGTGKSLAILCASLAYLTHLSNNTPEKRLKQSDPSDSGTNLPKIYICSRTHKQIDQLIGQLRKTNYSTKIAVLGSRTQYCIHRDVKHATDVNTACREAVENKRCLHRHRVSALRKRLGDVYDIEEIRKEGMRCGGCPYYASRELVEEASVVFAPYNYVIDPSIRSSMDIRLERAHVIVDEAHNVEDVCRAAGSLEFGSRSIDGWLMELIGALKKAELLESEDESTGIRFREHFSFLAQLMRSFKGSSFRTNQKTRDFAYKMSKGGEIRAELKKAGIGADEQGRLREAASAVAGSERAKQLLSQGLLRMIESLDLILQNVLVSGRERCYAFVFKVVERGPSSTEFAFWLLDPSLVFRPLVSTCLSITLLSGTLAPFDSLCLELSHSFQNKVVAPHILSSDQVFVAAVSHGHQGAELLGTYANSEKPLYLEQVASIIGDVAGRVRPHGGTLVFVPSYHFQRRLGSLIEEAVLEPQGADRFEDALRDYKRSLATTAPATMICVYRGKAAEGIDFRDSFARAVILVGVPYPSVVDPQVKVKREFNDSLGNGFNGSQWYGTQAMRAVNQALGRVVRHPGDWGCVFMLESRYRNQQMKRQLPGWIGPFMREVSRYERVVDEFNGFIEKSSVKYGSDNKTVLDRFIIGENKTNTRKGDSTGRDDSSEKTHRNK
ncbi:CHL1 [Enterospora canceri]|uniref:DNA 5'-3' helicase n=1 Tax=Enterospora canceri TaxID=1081671 RepID=A0A1Y1S5T2_9MICR|nr:CHL1 [Enterospora canceri]